MTMHAAHLRRNADFDVLKIIFFLNLFYVLVHNRRVFCFVFNEARDLEIDI